MTLVLSLFVFACNNGSDIIRPGDVSGVYLLTYGTQHVVDNLGMDQTDTFSEEDGIKMSVMQSNLAVFFFVCLGTLERDLTAICETQEIKYLYGAECSETVSGKMEFEDGVMHSKTALEMNCPDLGYHGTNAVELTLKFFASFESMPSCSGSSDGGSHS
jgi:hypothetical protein